MLAIFPLAAESQGTAARVLAAAQAADDAIAALNEVRCASGAEGRPRHRAAAARRHRILFFHDLNPFGRQAVVGDEMDELAVEAASRAEAGVADARGILGDGIKNRLNVGR